MKNPLATIDEAAKKLFKIAPFVSILAPAMVIVCGIGLVFAVMQTQKALAAGGKEAAVILQKTAKPKLDTTPLDVGGYMDAAAVLGRLNPSVKIGYAKDRSALQVTVQDAAQLPEWLYLLSTVQSYRKGLVWTASELCLKKCDGGFAATADLKSFTQKITVE